MLFHDWQIESGLLADQLELSSCCLTHREAIHEFLLHAQQRDRLVIARDGSLQVHLLQHEVRHVHVRRLAQRIDLYGCLTVADGRVDVRSKMQLQDAQVDVREREPVRRDLERFVKLVARIVVLPCLDEQLPVVVEDVGRRGEGGLRLLEDSARLRVLTMPVQSHGHLDPSEDGLGIELRRFAQVNDGRLDVVLQDVQLAAMAIDVGTLRIVSERAVEIG
mmetsp:Transcript_54714/g.126009  ORF Transcript_54714/g.126009 Transcript_54714/m.126009 type:complete len:220 (+) Transcript_54714:320-979(+)